MKQDKIPTFIIVSREYFHSPLWILKKNQKRTKAEAYLDLFQMATFKEDKYTTPDYKTTIPMHRGEGVWSIRFLAKRWHWSKSKAETFQNLLKHRHKVRQQTRQGIMVTFLVDYDESQKQERYGKGKKKDTKQDTKSDRVRTGSGQGQDKLNNDKECINNEKEVITLSAIADQIKSIYSNIEDKRTSYLYKEYIELAKERRKTGKITATTEYRLLTELENLRNQTNAESFLYALYVAIKNEAPSRGYIIKVLSSQTQKKKRDDTLADFERFKGFRKSIEENEKKPYVSADKIWKKREAEIEKDNKKFAEEQKKK